MIYLAILFLLLDVGAAWRYRTDVPSFSSLPFTTRHIESIPVRKADITFLPPWALFSYIQSGGTQAEGEKGGSNDQGIPAVMEVEDGEEIAEFHVTAKEGRWVSGWEGGRHEAQGRMFSCRARGEAGRKGVVIARTLADGGLRASHSPSSPLSPPLRHAPPGYPACSSIP